MHTGATWDSAWIATNTYWVESNNGNCVIGRTAVKIVVNPLPPIAPSATPSTICNGDSAQLAANNFTSASVAMPAQGTTFTGNVRGYSFTAPTNFTITGLQDLGVGAGLQSIAIVKFVPAVAPPVFAATTNAFVTLFLTQNNANLGQIPVNIPINAGDVIGVLSCRGTTTSYATPVGPYITSIAGFPVTLTRMIMQFGLPTTAPQDLSTETAAAIGRCQITYAVGDPNVGFNWQPALSLNSSTVANPKAGPSATTIYTLLATDNKGCSNTANVTLNVNPTPPIPTIDSVTNIFCGCGSATIYAVANGTGTIIRWYDAATGGNFLGTGSPFATPYYCGARTYYAEEYDLVTGCVSATRAALLVTPLAAVSIDAGTDVILCDLAGPAALNVTSGNTNYSYSWSPSFGLNVTTGTSVSANPLSNTTYTVTGTDGGCVNQDTVTVFVGLTPVISSTTALPANVCAGDTSQLNVIASVIGLLDYAWSPSASLTSATVTNPKAVPLVGTTEYTVVASNNGCTASSTVSVTAQVTPPAPVAVGDTVCGPDTVHVSAIPSNISNSLLWTDTIGGQIINNGNSYSQYVTKSGSFYVTEASGTGSVNVGYNGFDAASGYFPDAASFMNFTVINTEGIILNTVDVATNLGAGTWPLVVALVNSSGQIVSVHDTIYITGGSTALQTVTLNMFVPQGNWRLQPIFNPNLSVHQLAAVTSSLPWSIPGIINISCFGNASNACFSTTPTGTFGLFYNWNIATVCNSLQSIVSYEVNPSSPIGIASTGGMQFCDSATTILSAVDSAGNIYENYEWSPATGLSATTGTSVALSGLTQTTIYTLTAHDVDAGCNAITTKTITVQPKPTLLLSFHDTTICRTEPSLPFNSTAAKSSVVQIGTRTDPNFAVGLVYGGNTTQYSQLILTPAELNAAGLFGPTNITSLAFFVSTKLTTTTYTIDIKMRSDVGVPAVFPSTAHINTGLTTVYNDAATASTLGWNTYTFPIPFNWDGVSNLLVSECFTHNIPGFFDVVSTSSVSVARFNALNASACGAATGALLNDRPNVRFTGGTVFYSWSPGVGLSSATTEDPIMSPNFFSVDTALYYQLTVTDPLSGCTATDSILVNVSSTPPIPDVSFIGDSVLCFSGAPKMRAYATSGSLQWQISTDSINFTDISGATNDTLNAVLITATAYYRIYAYCGDTSYSRIMKVLVNNPQIVSTIADTVCGLGQVCLTATQNLPEYDVNWYSAATGGTLLGTGNSYCTTISATTTFYAGASTQGGAPVTAPYFNYTTTLGSNSFPFANSAGKEVQWFVGPGEFTQPTATPSGGLITSISFYAASAGNATYNTFTIKLGQLASPYAGGALYAGPMTTVILPASKTIVTTIGTFVTLTLDVPFAYDPTKWLVIDVGHCGYTGTGFNVYQNTLTGIRRVYSVGGCPFVWTNNDATLPGISIGLTTGAQCSSTRIPVIAVSTPPPAMSTVAHADTICESSCGTIGVDSAGQANYQVFNWSPSTGLTTTTGASVQACPLVTTTYTVVAIDTIGGCQKSDTVRVKVNPQPTLNVSATPNLICLGDSAQLESGAGGGSPTPVILTTPLTVGNSSSAVGFDLTNTTAGPLTIHFLSYTSSVSTGTLVQSVYYNPVPMNCVFPTNVTTAPGWVLIGSASCTVTGVAPNLTLIPLDLNITIPAGQTYAFALGGFSVAYTTGTSGCPTLASDANILVKEGFGGTLTGTIGNRRFNGSVSYTTGGSLNLTNSWSPATGLSSATIHNPKASPATSTTYTVTVTNSLTGCAKSDTVTVNVRPNPKPYLTTQDTAVCSTTSELVIEVNDSGTFAGGYPTGTTFDFIGYSGAGPDSTYTLNSTGFYAAIVKLPIIDYGGCFDTTAASHIVFGGGNPFYETPQLGLETDSVLCFGESTGKVIGTIVFGGNPTFRYQWYNSSFNLVRDTISADTVDVLTGMPAGYYYFKVTDHQDSLQPPYCEAESYTIYLGEPDVLSVSENLNNHVDLICNGIATGAVDIEVTGGTLPYSYNWSNGASTQDLNSTLAGTYICTITDGHGCTVSISSTLTQPLAVTANCSVSPVTCFAGNNGTASASAGGGIPGYTYAWSNGGSSSSIGGLIAGTYTVLVTDASGCTATCSSEVTEPPLIVPAITGNAAFCAASSTILSASGGYATYSWSTGASTQAITVNSVGTFSVMVTNGSGCTGTASITTSINPLPTPSISGVAVICVPGSVVITANAGYSAYLWSTGTATQSATVTGGGPYTVTVTDGNGCTATATKSLQVSTSVPAQPGTINGAASLCKNSTLAYNIVPVAGASSYNWTVGAGASVTTGQGTNSVTITFSNTAVSASISVTAINVCGPSIPRTKPYVVSGAAPVMPMVINGSLFANCNKLNVPYNCTVVANAVSYNWTVPAGATIASGQGTNAITVNYGSTFTTNGLITVVAVNGCGTSAAQIRTTNARPAQPVISGLNHACPYQTGMVYTVAPIAGATNYTWTVVSGCVILSGQGTPTLTVKWGNVGGIMSCTANNACGASTKANYSVSLVCKEIGSAFDFSEMNLYPNPASSTATLQFDASSEGKGQVMIYDLVGKQQMKQDVDVIIGVNMIEMSLVNLPKGVYSVIFEYNGLTRTKKLIVQ